MLAGRNLAFEVGVYASDVLGASDFLLAIFSSSAVHELILILFRIFFHKGSI